MTRSDSSPGRDFVAAVLGVDTDYQPDEQHLGRRSGWWREFWTALAGRAGAGTDFARSRPDDDPADKAGASHSTMAPSGATIAAPPNPDPHADEDIPAADPPRLDSPSASARSADAPRHQPADDNADPELDTAPDISARSGVPVLLNAAGRGDQDAWAEIVRRYGPEVYRIARGALLLEADVHEVLQITWLRLVENLPMLDWMHDQKEFEAWLSTVTRRESLRILRQRGSHPPGSLGPTRARALRKLADDVAFPQLTVREREILGLVAAGRPNAQIAAILHLSPKTVRNNVSNIFAKLHVADRAEAIVQARDAGLGRQ